MQVNTVNRKPRTVLFVVLSLVIIIGLYFAFQLYANYFAGNVSGNQKYLYIPTNAKYKDVLDSLEKNNGLKDIRSFDKAAQKMGLPTAVKSGRYLLKKGLNNRALVNMLKSGNQEPVSLKIQNIRKKENLAGFLSRKLEADSASFEKLLDSVPSQNPFGLTSENVYVMYIPNTYEVYWNTSPSGFFDKMQKEYVQFWNSERLGKAQAINLKPAQVGILASIVDAEALYDKEMPIIAGLYLNRLKRGIMLQADPTVIYANNDFTVKRVTNSLLRVDSRYNTYRYAGLPPGPIMMPSIRAIDAVLNPENNNFIYMCAKEDFSGYHNFAATQAEHEINARKYRDALNKRKIYK